MTILTMIQKMSEGLGRTCTIFFLTLVFSLPLGMLVALMRMSKFKPLSYVTQVMISILRFSISSGLTISILSSMIFLPSNPALHRFRRRSVRSWGAPSML